MIVIFIAVHYPTIPRSIFIVLRLIRKVLQLFGAHHFIVLRLIRKVLQLFGAHHFIVLRLIRKVLQLFGAHQNAGWQGGTIRTMDTSLQTQKNPDCSGFL